MSTAYTLQYAKSVRRHLEALTARDRAILRIAIPKQLLHEPSTQSRNRKLMGPNPLAAGWELRIGRLRVYYDLDEAARTVTVLAVGTKDRNRVVIGGREIDLQ